MITEKFKEYIEENLIFKVDNYKYPTVVIGLKRPRENLFKIRQVLLLEDESIYVERFKSDIKNIGLEAYIEEFLIPIDNRELWWKCCSTFGVTNSSLRDIVTFSLDFYYPGSNLAVEIDGKQHMENRPYDHARDMYIQERWGIKTLRSNLYGYQELENWEFLENIKKSLEINPYSPVDFSDFIFSTYSEIYCDELKVIEILLTNYFPKVTTLRKKDWWKISDRRISNIPKFNHICEFITGYKIKLI